MASATAKGHPSDHLKEHLPERNRLIAQLSDELTNRFGLTPSQQVLSRLDRLLLSFNHYDLSRYIQHLHLLPSSHPLWLFLVERQVVRETYLFRDKPQLDLLEQALLPEMISFKEHQADRSINVWSAACSTGEEVYTLAILIMNAMLQAQFAFGTPHTCVTLLPNWGVKVLGTDISTIALNKAKNGLYVDEPLGSFRNINGWWKDWFEKVDFRTADAEDRLYDPYDTAQKIYKPKGFIRELVHFLQNNLIQPLGAFQQYDIIFCRNVLIYFNEEDKQKIQKHLFHALKPGGILILGLADQMLLDNALIKTGTNGVYYYEKPRSDSGRHRS